MSGDADAHQVLPLIFRNFSATQIRFRSEATETINFVFNRRRGNAQSEPAFYRAEDHRTFGFGGPAHAASRFPTSFLTVCTEIASPLLESTAGVRQVSVKMAKAAEAYCHVV